MRKQNKLVAIVLTATMLVGGALTAFATDPDPSATGTGSVEGHVNKHIISVALPTVADNAFNYTLDLERLIKDTTAERYDADEYQFPTGTDDKGVYFATAQYDEVGSPAVADIGKYYEAEVTNPQYALTTDKELVDGGEYYTEESGVYTKVATPAVENIKTYYVVVTPSKTTYKKTTDTAIDENKTYYTRKLVNSATSEVYTVTNKSTDAIKLNLEVEANDAEANVTLVDEAPTAAATMDSAANAKLYLGLKVGSADAVPVVAGQKVTKEVDVAGTTGNYMTKYENNAYSYIIKRTAAELTWASTTFSLEGAANYASAEGLRAPNLTVTWKYSDPAAGPSATMTETGLITISNATCTSSELKSIELSSGAEKYTASAANATFGDPSAGTITIQLGDGWLESWSGKVVNVKVILGDDTEVTAQATFE